MGHEVVFMQNEKDELPVPYDSVDAVICNGLFLYHPIEKFSSLRYIQLTSAGYDRVPMDYVREKGIAIFNAGGVYSIPMAEFAVAGVLTLLKEIRFFSANQKLNNWEKHRSLIELFDKTVCIVGCGNVGTECAIRFNAFGCHVIGVDAFPRKDNHYKKMYPVEQLHTALKESEIVVLTLPLTDETYHLIDSNAFNAMKDGTILVNIARGAVIDSEALTNSLSNKLRGAVLDVFEQEPLDKNSPLWNMENVILTPHNSYVGNGNSERLRKKIINNLENYK